MKRHGFTILELIVAMLIASIVMMMLLSALRGAGTFQTSVDDFVHVGYRATIAQRQLTRDFIAAFIPVQAQEQKKEEEQKTEKEPDEKTEKTTDAEKKQKGGKKEDGPEKEKKKPLENVFVAGHENKRFSFVSCISSNPMETYWSEKTGSPKPRVVRIYYYLEPNKENKKNFTLFRQEGTDLEMAPYQKKGEKAPRGYPLINDIKNMTVEYGVTIEQKKEGADKNAKVEREYKISAEWTSNRKKEKEQKKQDEQPEEPKRGEKKEPELPLIPHWVKITLDLWDNKQTNSRLFTFIIPIPIDSLEHKDEKKEQKKPAKKETTEDGEKQIDKKDQQQKKTESQATVTLEEVDGKQMYVVRL
ncbi:MAG TPA: prepilin-type N-terminal cleavage/methylation domain-containing protein [Candidatus Bathyarchaeia archaeon]|nr:prepilin-type N-terminal cleavage/methylation domain-containing protein [Candidatus Bathyarchaeia archaeon]